MLAEIEEIVVVATHAARLHARPRVFQRPHRWQPLWKEPRLYLHRDLELVRRAALGFLLFGGGATLRLDRATDLIEADERERIAIDVLEPREGSAPC